MKVKKCTFIIICALIMLFGLPAQAERTGYLTAAVSGAVSYTPKTDIFRFDDSGEEFILLDHDEEGFFVTTKAFFGIHTYDPDSNGKFDIEDTNNMAYWLNNDFIYNGNTNSDSGEKRELPAVAIKHIIEHDWVCEAGHSLSDFPEDYTVHSKLALMSLTEYKKYAKKIGTADNESISYYYFLRTVNGNASDSPIMVMYGNGTTNYGKAWNKYGVRPVFYLDGDTFITERLKLTETGDNVIKMIRELYSDKQLSKIYSKTELDAIHKRLPPQAAEVSVTGVPRAGRTLTLSYKYISPEDDAEGETVIRWLRAKNKEGPYSTIRGEDKNEYTLTNEDAGCFVLAEITPISKKRDIGTTVRSKTTTVRVKAATAPYADNVRIKGSASVGARLIADYEYIDHNDSFEKGTTALWQRSADNENFEDIPGETGLNLLIPEDCKDCYIRCIVTVHNETEPGAPVVSESVGPVKDISRYPEFSVRENAGFASVDTELFSNDKIAWMVKDASGNTDIVFNNDEIYTYKGGETELRAVILAMDERGYITDTYASDMIHPQSAAPKQDPVDTISINGTETVEVCCLEGRTAYAVKLVLTTQGTEIASAESESYNIYPYENDGGKTYILSLKPGAAAKETVMTFKVSGNGTVKLEDADAAYGNRRGKAELSLRKGE